MIVASDSLVSGGISLDQAPKLLRLERNDSVLAFCGTTRIAYPLMVQIKLALDAYQLSRTRVVDIVDLKAHIEKVIESVRVTIADLPDKSGENTDFKLMLAGYSWKLQQFRSWVFKFDLLTHKFNAFKMTSHRRQFEREGRGKVYFQFMSDNHQNEKRASEFVLRELHKTTENQVAHALDWIPMRALIDQIKDQSCVDIGGAPQMVKIFKHSNTLPINVIWHTPEPDRESGLIKHTYHLTHFGRKLLPYERNDYLNFDPEGNHFVEPWNVREWIDILQYLEQERFVSARRNHLIQRICQAIAKHSKRKDKTEQINAHLRTPGFCPVRLMEIANS